METNEIKFISGKQTLHGIINIVDHEAPTIIFIPGISGKALSERFDYLAKVFNETGYNFLRFNFRGYEDGNSFDNSSIDDELKDLENAISYLESQGYNLDKFGIIAKSFGAVKALLLHDKRLGCLGLLAPAVYFGSSSNLDTMRNKNYGSIEHISDIIIDQKMLKTWNTPTIIIHGNHDKTIALDNSRNIFEMLSCAKQLIIMSDAEHSLDENESQRKESIKRLTEFFKDNFPLA